MLGPVAETLAGMTPDTGRLQAISTAGQASPALEAADDLADRMGTEGVVRDDIEGSVPVLERESRAAQLGARLHRRPRQRRTPGMPTDLPGLPSASAGTAPDARSA